MFFGFDEQIRLRNLIGEDYLQSRRWQTYDASFRDECEITKSCFVLVGETPKLKGFEYVNPRLAMREATVISYYVVVDFWRESNEIM